MTKSLSFSNAASACKLAMGVFRARRILRAFAPDVVLGTGGYTTAAVLLAQRSLRGPLVIHEQNAVPGRTNLWLARIADKVCISFERSAAYFPGGKVVVTGMPVRREFASLPGKPEARRELGLDEGAFTILVVGGSQGARRVNELMLGAWSLVRDGATQVLHQAGKRNLDGARSLAADLADASGPGSEPGYQIEPYVDMPLALAGADLVIGRSGASTVAEVTAAGLPSILIPYPYAYADHQKYNASHVADRGAAVLCEESSCTPEILASLISDLRSSPDRLAAMSAASAALGRPDAARRVAEVVMTAASAE